MILKILQIIISVIVIILIAFQTKGGGLGSAWGGKELYSSKRGVEKFLFYVTVGAATLFVISSLINFLAQ
jgi:preprotein translocase subunit SecG